MAWFRETLRECVEASPLAVCALAVAGPVIACVAWMIVQALGRA